MAQTTKLDNLQHEVDRLTVINRILTAVNRAEEPRRLLSGVFPDLMQVSGADVGILHWFDGESGLLNLETYENVADKVAAKVEAIEPGVGPIGQAAQARKVIEIANVDEFEGRVRGFWEDHTIKKGFSMPLAGTSGLLGVLTLGTKVREVFDPATMRLLEDLADHVIAGAERVAPKDEALDVLAGIKTGRHPVACLIESIPAGVMLFDRQGVIITSNRNLESITGHIRMDLVGESVAELIPAWIRTNDVKDIIRISRMLEESRSVATGIALLKTKDGQEFYGSIDITFFEMEDPGPYSGVVIVRRSAKPLEAGRSLLAIPSLGRTMLDNNPIAIVAADLQGDITHAAPAALALHGYSQEEALVGMHLLELVAPEDRVKIIRVLDNIQAQERVGGLEILLQRGNGSRFAAELNVALVKDDEGQPHGIMTFATDLTRLKVSAAETSENDTAVLHDGLTGCYNRAALNDELQRLNRDLGRSHPLTLMTVDVHGIELINEIFGTESGDDLLVGAAEIITQPFRKIDKVCRASGNRFTVILPKVNPGIAMKKKDQILHMAGKANETRGKAPLHVSVGLATSETDSEETIYDLYRRSEQDLYEDKLELGMSPEQKVLAELMDRLETRDYLNHDSGSVLWKTMGILLSGLQLNDEETRNLQLMAHAHNMGYLIVPAGILEKPGELSPGEFEKVKRHSQVGCNIAIQSLEYAAIATQILHHHERWDGTGYPAGLMSNRIPRECRIFAIADAYAAMVSERPYRKIRSRAEAISELLDRSGSQFDPHLADEIVGLLEKG